MTQPVIVGAGGAAVARGVSEDLIVPKELDLMALPQLCFPGGSFTLQHSQQAFDLHSHMSLFRCVLFSRTRWFTSHQRTKGGAVPLLGFH